MFGSFWLDGPPDSGALTVEAPLVAQVPDAPQIQFAEPKPTVEPDISTDSLLVTGADDSRHSSGNVSCSISLRRNRKNSQRRSVACCRTTESWRSTDSPAIRKWASLGEYDMQRLLELLREQAAAYEEADPSRPVLIAFEVIASVAQQWPQDDGSYLLDTPTEVLNEYADFTRENGLLLILDAQIGYRTVRAGCHWVSGRGWPWSTFTWRSTPSSRWTMAVFRAKKIGNIDAADIQWAQQWLIDLVADEGDIAQGPDRPSIHLEMITNDKD